MSHFTVIVIGPNVEEQLQPFHEFECTGTSDQYVQDVDQTEEARAEYEKNTETMARLPDGTLVSAFDDRFYRPFTAEEMKKHGPIIGTGCGGGQMWSSRDFGDGKGYSTRMHDLGDAVEVKVSTKDVKSFRDWAEDYYRRETIVVPHQKPDLQKVHKYGWIEVDAKGDVVRVIHRTNPNAHWDWWQLGGRWTGFFPVKQGRVGVVGSPGLMTPRADENTADQLMWGDVDIDKARACAEQEARKWFAPWRVAFEAHGRPESWKAVLDSMPDDIDEARAKYQAQPAIAEYRKSRDATWRCPVEVYGFDEEAYVTSARRGALTPHAIVKDGQWHERGRMGWWGVVHDEADEAGWDARVDELLTSLPADTLVSLVDCHI